MTASRRGAAGPAATEPAAAPPGFMVRHSGKGTVDIIVVTGGHQTVVGTAKAISAGFWEADLRRAHPELGPPDTADGRGPMAYKLSGLRDLLAESIQTYGPWWQPPAAGQPAGAPGPASPPDLLDLPEEPPIPDRASIDQWSVSAMTQYLEATDRRAAWTLASKAAALRSAGAPHQEVMMALAGAENVAPKSDRPYHAARLDGYAAAHGLRGWYRGKLFPPAAWGPRDGHNVFVNLIRTPADGDRGRYYVSPSLAGFAVVDRDSGQTAAGPFKTSQEADIWKSLAEATADPASDRLAGPVEPETPGGLLGQSPAKLTGAVASTQDRPGELEL
jgi:hypothetical protein